MKNCRRIFHPITACLRHVALPLVCVLGVFMLHAQKMEPAPSTFHIGVKDGLPSSETYYVHQDKQGYMWFCTDRGVVKYDGFRVQVYNKSNGLPDDVIFKVIEDEKGRVWFYLYNGSLAYYDHKQEKMIPYRYNYQLRKLNHGDFNGVKLFSVDEQDNVYYTGLYESGKIDRNGKLFVYKRKSSIEMGEINGTWMRYVSPNVHDKSKQIIKFLPEKGNAFYHRYDNYVGGINKIDILTIKDEYFLNINDEVLSISTLKGRTFPGCTGIYHVDGEFWVATLTGAYRFKNPEKLDLDHPDGYYLRDQKVTSVAKDSEGGYWFSTLDNGIHNISCLDIVNWIPGKDRGVVLDINGIGNDVYYSSAFGYYHLGTGEQLFALRGAKNPIAVWDNKLILSTNTPYFLHDQIEKREFGLGMPQFQAWAIDQKGDLYMTYIMTFMLRKQSNVIEPLQNMEEIYNSKKYAAHYFKSLAFDENNKLYLGSLIGLFTIQNGKAKRIKLPPDLNTIRITDLEYHRAWGLVVATRGKGIFILKNGKVALRIQREDGLLSDQLNTIHIDQEENLYVGTNKGLSKIVKRGLKRIEIFNLTELNGLASSEVSAIYRNDKGVYVGTREGITLIPSNYKWSMSENAEQIGIQTVFANGKYVTGFKSGMKFNASHKVLRFLLQTTNYKSQHRQPYKYRFRKTDSWSMGFNGELILINPAFESYELELQYQNECGTWSQPYVLTSFSIQPPFYSTWWFTALVVLLILGIGFLLFRNRIKVIHSRNLMQAEIKQLEQKALLAQMNPHFIFNSLNSIQSFLIFNENELAERYLLKLSQLIRMTLTNSRESTISIEKEMEILQKYMELEQMRFKERFEFRITSTVSKGDLSKKMPPMLIQPFVENAIIHGFKKLNEGGKLEVRFLKIEEAFLFVEVRDNGLGYSNTLDTERTGHKSYGTRITSERLDLYKQKYGGDFNYTIETLREEPDGESNGTVVYLKIPIIVSE